VISRILCSPRLGKVNGVLPPTSRAGLRHAVDQLDRHRPDEVVIDLGNTDAHRPLQVRRSLTRRVEALRPQPAVPNVARPARNQDPAVVAGMASIRPTASRIPSSLPVASSCSMSAMEANREVIVIVVFSGVSMSRTSTE
jgi:hypothetical protein